MTSPRTILLLACLYSFTADAQDKIYLEKNSIQGKITEITSTEIKYISPEKPETTLLLPLGKALILINGQGFFLVPSRSGQPLNPDLVTGFLSADTSHRAKDQLYTRVGDKIEGVLDREDSTSLSLSDGTKVDKKKLAVLIHSNGQSMIYCPVDVAAALLDVYQLKQTTPPHASPLSNTSPATVPSTASASMAPTPSPSPNSSDTAVLAQKPDSAQRLDFAAVAGNVSKKEFEEKAEKKTTQFTEYLKILCDKTADFNELNKAINQAMTLFVNENAMIETSSNNRNTVSRLKIRDYLTKVKKIQYDRIEIEWTHVQYVSDLKPGPDGNFYGNVSFEQEFRGYRDGKLVYSDVTRKNATVVLKTYQKNIEGTTTNIWDVLLCDVGVMSTKAL